MYTGKKLIFYLLIPIITSLVIGAVSRNRPEIIRSLPYYDKLAVYIGNLHGFKTYRIEINSSSFSPNRLELKKGDYVIFVNKDNQNHWPASNMHPSHDLYPEFDPRQAIEPGNEWKFQFLQAGGWYFHDHLNPGIGGKITVKGDVIKPKMQTGKNEEEDRKMIDKIEKENDKQKRILLIQNLTYQVGPDRALKLLKSANISKGGDIHLLSHIVGQVAFELYGEKAIAYCQDDEFNGCQHGIFSTAISEVGIEGVKRMIATCKSQLPLYRFQTCIHGLGHALTIMEDYQVPKALDDCEKFNDPKIMSTNTHDIEKCYVGVFMENVFGEMNGLIPILHPYLDPKNLIYPCDSVSEKYKYPCYFNQAGWWFPMLNRDVEKTAKMCFNVLKQFVPACADSFGRTVQDWVNRDAEKLIEYCGLLPTDGFLPCITAVVKSNFGQGEVDFPLAICKSLKSDSQKKECYNAMIFTMDFREKSQDYKDKICGLFEPEFHNLCVRKTL